MLIESFQARNLLSFGPRIESLDLGSLNILIGANGSGKSNLIACLGLLPGAAEDLSRAFTDGINDWLYKPHDILPEAFLEVLVSNESSREYLRHTLRFTGENDRVKLLDERITATDYPLEDHSEPTLFFGYKHGHPYVNTRGEDRKLERESVDPNQSILSQRRDPEQYPELTFLAKKYESIRIFSGWFHDLKKLQKSDLPNDFLNPGADNLTVVLNEMISRPRVRKELEHHLGEYSSTFERLHTKMFPAHCQVLIEEVSGRSIPATRLSDGTLRYLCLLAILLHPAPPPLICIEEPELGLHPDILPVLGGLLRSASERTQIIVTTHSETLVSCFSDTPEDVVVCEMDGSATRFSRLERDDLSRWLERYSLGELWSKGELGGNRW